MALVQMRYPVQAINAQRLLDQVRPRVTSPVSALPAPARPPPDLFWSSLLRVNMRRLLLRKRELSTSKSSAELSEVGYTIRGCAPHFSCLPNGGRLSMGDIFCPPEVAEAGLTAVLGRDAFLLSDFSLFEV